MKTYTKKEDRVNANALVTTIVMLLFVGGPLVFYIYLISLLFLNYHEFWNIFFGGIILILFSLFFFINGMFILITVLKPPKIISGRLVTKKREIYKNKEITYLVFAIYNDELYKCYTKGENDFKEGEIYDLYIKEAYFKVVKVKVKKEGEKDNNNKILFQPNVKDGANIVILGIIFIFLGSFIVIFLKTLYDIFKGKFDGELIIILLFLLIMVIAGFKVKKKF